MCLKDGKQKASHRHALFLLLAGAHIQRRSTRILLLIEIHPQNDAPLPNGFCLFFQNTGFCGVFYWILFSFLGHLNSEEMSYNFSHFTTFNCLKE